MKICKNTKTIYNTIMNVKVIDLSVGQTIIMNGVIYRVVKKSMNTPGRWCAMVQTELRSLSGVKLERRFRCDDVVEIVMMTSARYKFSYSEKNFLFFTHSETFETLEVSKADLPNDSVSLLENFAEENPDVTVEFVDDKILDVKLKSALTVEVINADAVVKGQTATSSYKPAEIKGGIRILVPQYIGVGDKIVINPYGESGIEFTSRA
jgi:elongation factor P